MNKETKRLVEKKARGYNKSRIKYAHFDACVEAYTAGAIEFYKRGYNQAIKDALKLVKFNMDETIQDNMKEIHNDLQQLKEGGE